MRKTTHWSLFIFSIMLILTVGCSKKSTDSSELSQGDPNDPLFLQAQQSSEELVGSVLGGVDESIDYMDYNGSGPFMKPADTLFLNMYDDYWYEYRFELITLSGAWAQSDSFRFESGSGEYQVLPDTNTSAFEFKNKSHMEYSESDTSMTIDNISSFRFGGINTDQATVNGTADSDLEMTYGVAEAGMDFSSQLQDIVYLTGELDYGETNYPISGVMELSVAVNSNQQIGDIPGMNFAWSLTVTFNENGYHARLESGDYYWEWDETWGPV